MSHRIRIALGAMMATAGLTGVLVLGPVFPVAAQPANTAAETHEAMDAMNSPWTADRMHQVPGAEQMLDQCAVMMTSMDGGMMDGEMMDG